MIALTQEKREKLIADCKKAISDAEIYINCYGEREDIVSLIARNRIALASLMAEPVAYTSESALADVYCGDTSMMGGGYDIGNIPLFTAPPVQKINLPSSELIKEVFLANGFKEKTQPDGSVDLNPYVYESVIALINLLNGSSK